MQRVFYYYIMCIGLAWLSLSCTEKKEHYVIGVSQCSQDIWRNKLNDELLMGTYFHDDVELRFASADDSDERQIAQVDSLVAQGIDLLIVAPNQVGTLSSAIDRAFDKGIPVIVFDRKTDSQKFTAYIGADNEEMGRQMGEYIATQLNGHGRVLEIMGLKGSSPAIERHRGFTEALSHYPGIELVAALQGDWTEDSAVEAIGQYDGDLNHIDFVFGQNDRMAVGARKALSTLSTNQATKFCGIDGLPGEGGGLECVRDSVLDASYIYPTRGDDVLQLTRLIPVIEKSDFHRAMHRMGFPAGSPELRWQVRQIRFQKDRIGVEGIQGRRRISYQGYQFGEFPMHTLFDAKAGSFQMEIPIVRQGGIAAMDLRIAGIDEKKFEKYPGFGSGFLVVEDRDGVKYREVNLMVQEIITLFEESIEWN